MIRMILVGDLVTKCSAFVNSISLTVVGKVRDHRP